MLVVTSYFMCSILYLGCFLFCVWELCSHTGSLGSWSFKKISRDSLLKCRGNGDTLSDQSVSAWNDGGDQRTQKKPLKHGDSTHKGWRQELTLKP